jgi:dienelactone hydrolase
MVEQQSATFMTGGRKYAIDRYAVKNASAKRPAVVIVHGVDGLGTASGKAIRLFAEQIAGHGVLVYVPHYFDVHDGADSLPLDQLLGLRVPRVASYAERISAAVDHALGQPDADARRLGLVGLSLGGGLVLEYAEAAAPGKVAALVDYFGHIADPAIITNVKRLPPTLIFHNKADMVVKLADSSAPLLAALQKTTVVHDHCFYDDINPDRGQHPFLPGGRADVDSRARSVAWLKTYLMPST